MGDIPNNQMAAVGGIIVGLIFGMVSLKGDFCLRSAIISNSTLEQGKQILIWIIALITSVIGVYYLKTQSLFTFIGSSYRMESFNPVAILLGGFVFGIGMTMTRGCLGRHLVLGGKGNIRSWIVLLVAGLSAYATHAGILSGFRIYLEDILPIPLQQENFQIYVLIVILLIILAVGLFFSKAIVANLLHPSTILIAMVIGFCVIAGFWITEIWLYDEMDLIPVSSIRFNLPLGEAIFYLLTFNESSINFNMAVIAGVPLGSFIIALLTQKLELTGFESPSDILRYLLGGLLMGFGGVLTLGCAIGQGISGLSTLSVTSFFAIFSIVLGCLFTHRYWR